MKLGYVKAKSKTDEACLVKAEKYLVSLNECSTYQIVTYNTDRGDTYGVIVSDGDRITIWNSFTEKLESMSRKEFERRVRS